MPAIRFKVSASIPYLIVSFYSPSSTKVLSHPLPAHKLAPARSKHPPSMTIVAKHAHPPAILPPRASSTRCTIAATRRHLRTGSVWRKMLKCRLGSMRRRGPAESLWRRARRHRAGDAAAAMASGRKSVVAHRASSQLSAENCDPVVELDLDLIFRV